MTGPLNITIVGCGKMGGALVRGWLASGLDAHINILEPGTLDSSLKKEGAVTHFTAPAAPLTDSDIFVMAIKPQVMGQACADLKPFVKPDALILSIAAGQSLARFAQYFGENQPVIRAMPNTPAAIGKGISVLVANSHVNDTQKTHATVLLETSGEVCWVEDEALLNPVTALSGSGPAYMFLLIETLAKAGENAGLEPEFAMRLARQTVIGAAALAENAPGTPAGTLRQNVTSPGGTTQAALEILMNGDLQELFDTALAAASKRAEELS